MQISRLRAELARVKYGARHPRKSDGVLRQGSEVKYAFIQRRRRVWPIRAQCRVLGVSVAGYHGHVARRASTVPRRVLRVHIKAIHAQTHGGYGWPRTWKELLACGLRVGKDRVRIVEGRALAWQRFNSRRQAKDEIIAWLLWYNRTRLHWTLAYVSPMRFEENWRADQPRQASA